MAIPIADRPTALYRLYDANNVLLYIGITDAPKGRWSSHASVKAWWPEVARKELEWFDNRALAELAEEQAIASERTPHNVAGSPWAPKPRELGSDEMLVTEAKKNLGEVVTSVRLRDRPVRIVRPTRDRAAQAAIVPIDILDLIEQLGGLGSARATMHKAINSAKG